MLHEVTYGMPFLFRKEIVDYCITQQAAEYAAYETLSRLYIKWRGKPIKTEASNGREDFELQLSSLK